MAPRERLYPAIPEPTQDVTSLLKTVKALKEVVETLTGQRNAATKGIGEQLTDILSVTDRARARFTEYVEVTATANTALVQRTTTLEAEVTSQGEALVTTNAKITQVEKAYADADKAIAETVTTLEASYKAADQQITTETDGKISETRRVLTDADNAIVQYATEIEAAYKVADDGVLSQTSASISDVATASANRDEALAQRVTTLEARDDNGFASGSLEFKVSAAPSGYSARYDLVLKANSVLAGFSVLAQDINGQKIGSIVLTADKFRLDDPTLGPTPVFEYANQVFQFNVPVKVRGKELENRATTNSVYSAKGDFFAEEVISIREGAIVDIFADFGGQPNVSFSANNAAQWLILFRVKDGVETEIYRRALSYYVDRVPSPNRVYFTYTGLTWQDNPPPNSYAYRAVATNGLGPVAIRITELYK